MNTNRHSCKAFIRRVNTSQPASPEGFVSVGVHSWFAGRKSLRGQGILAFYEGNKAVWGRKRLMPIAERTLSGRRRKGQTKIARPGNFAFTLIDLMLVIAVIASSFLPPCLAVFNSSVNVC
jgi:hypothetical protein